MRLKSSLSVIVFSVIAVLVFAVCAKADVSIPNFNLSGDAGYLRHAGWVGGVGTDVISVLDGKITLRGQALWYMSESKRTKDNVIAGIGVMASLYHILSNRAEWHLGIIRPKFGAFVGYDLSGGRFDYGVVLQAIKVEF